VIRGGTLSYIEGTQADQLPGGAGIPLLNEPPGQVTDVSATVAADGRIDVFAAVLTNGSYSLLHLHNDGIGWSTPAPLCSGPLVEALIEPDGDLAFVAWDGGDLSYGSLDAESAEWSIRPIEQDVLTSDAIEEIRSYAATVSAYETTGAPMYARQATIEVTEPVQLIVQGATVALDPKHPWSGSTDLSGQIRITYPTTALSAPTLALWVDGMTTTARCFVDLSGEIRSTLQSVTAQELLDAKPVWNSPSDYTTLVQSPLLAGDDQTRNDNADYLHRTCTAALSLARTATAAGSADHLHPHTSPNVARYVPEWDGTPPNLIHVPSLPDVHFRLAFGAGRAPRFEALDAAGAQAAKESLLAQGDITFDGLWGDIFDAVGYGLASLEDLVVTVKNGVEAAIRFTIGAVHYVWNGLIHVVEQLLDITEAAFEKAAVKLEAIIGWIGWVFDWGDILRVHEVLVYLAEYTTKTVAAELRGVKATVDNGIEALRQVIREQDTSGTNPLGSQTTLAAATAGVPASNGKLPAPTDPRNVIARSVTDQANAGTAPQPDIGSDPQSPGFDKIQALDAYVPRFNATQAGTALGHALTPADLSSGAAGVLALSLPDLLKPLCDGADELLSLAEDGIDSILDLLASGAEGLCSDLSSPWDVPFVSHLYRKVTNHRAELSTLDLGCLVIAIPTTIVYKTAWGTTPFPNEISVKHAKNALPLPGQQAVVVAAGTAATPVDDWEATVHTVAICAAAAAEGFLTVFNTFVDVTTAQANAVAGKDIPFDIFDWLVVVFETLTFATYGAALLTDPVWGTVWRPSTSQGLKKCTWAASSLEIVADGSAAIATKLEKSKGLVRRNWGDIGPSLVTLWGALQAVGYIIAWVWDGQENPNDDKVWLRNAPALIGTGPDIFKFFIGPTVAKGSGTIEGVSIAAIAIGTIDVVCGVADLILACFEMGDLLQHTGAQAHAPGLTPAS
jgi:hypothetical protein